MSTNKMIPRTRMKQHNKMESYLFLCFSMRHTEAVCDFNTSFLICSWKGQNTINCADFNKQCNKY